MGTKTAPSYANLFMARLKVKLLEKAKTDLQIELPLYLRYIDDIFFIFPYSETKLEQFMTLMNSYHKTIKFAEEHSRNEIIFLDTYVKRDKDSLYTDLYVKETATHSSLHYTSCHPKYCTRKGPYGNSLRIKRNCAKSADWKTLKGHENALCEPRLPWWNHQGIIKKHAIRTIMNWFTAQKQRPMAERGSHCSLHTTRSTQTCWKSSRNTGQFYICRQNAKNYSKKHQFWHIAETETCEIPWYEPTFWSQFKR